MELVNRFNEFVAAANETNSSNDKKEVLKQFSDLKKLFTYVYNPFWQYGVSVKNLDKHPDLVDKTKFESVFDLFDALRTREVTGNAAIGVINNFIRVNPTMTGIVYAVLERNLKTRISTSIINDVFPGTVPKFSVALANSFDKIKNINFVKDNWIAEQKLDGVRCIAIVDEKGNTTFFSRNGKEFDTLGKIAEEIKNLNFSSKSLVLDGEICMVDENGKEDFQGIMKQIRRKDYTIPNPKFKLFDILTFEGFFGQEEVKGNYEARLNILKNVCIAKKPKFMEVVWYEVVNNQEHFEQLCSMATDKGWEGLILRKANSKYEGKRTNNLLKVKKFHDAEYVVLGADNGPIRHIVNGKEVTSEMLSNVFIEHRGNTVRVGSGFSIEQRQEFYRDPSKIVGKTITVKYFEETKNQNGEYSLRFPTIKTIFDGERDV